MLCLYEVVTLNLQSETRLFLPVFQTWHAIPYHFIPLSKEYFVYLWKASLKMLHYHGI